MIAVGSDGVAVVDPDWWNTMLRPAHAWSAEEPATEAEPERHHRHWGWATGWAAAIVGVTVGGAMLGVHVLLAPHHASAESVTPAMPTLEAPATTEEATLPPETFEMPDETAPAALITDDGRYLQMLRAGSIAVPDPARAVAGGRNVCRNLAEGMTRGQLVLFAWRNDHTVAGLDVAHIALLVNDAISVYCPEQR